MGVLIKSKSDLDESGKAERGVAVLADVMAEGKLLVMGVTTSSLGLGPGIVREVCEAFVRGRSGWARGNRHRVLPRLG